MLNEQQSYEKICAGFATQGCRAIDEGDIACSYYIALANGGCLRCALGQLGTVEQAMEWEASLYTSEGIAEELELSADFTSRMQSAHDAAYNSAESFQEALASAAIACKLKPGAELAIKTWSNH